MRALLVVLAAAIILLLASRVVLAQASPEIEVSPPQSPQGASVTINGNGFPAGDVVFLEIFSVDSPASESIRIETVTTDATGAFQARADFTAGVLASLTPGQYTILAYPKSFGDRTSETLGIAPKAEFRLTGPSAQPGSGGPPGIASAGAFQWIPLAAGGLLALLGAAALLFYWRSPHGTSGRQGPRGN
jgi:hypothetical protein